MPSWGRQSQGLGDTNGDGYADIAVAAPLFNGAAADSGFVQFFQGSSTGISAASARSFEGTQVSEEIGRSLSGGDPDNDGFADLLIGAPRADDAAFIDSGRIMLARGVGSVPDNVHDTLVESNVINASLGNAMASGDLNGDGFTDLAVGAFGQNAGEARYTLFWVSSTGLPSIPTTVLTTSSTLEFGISVAIGDLNGNGFGDLIVGASQASNGQGSEGLVHVYWGCLRYHHRPVLRSRPEPGRIRT
ncbi:MAG: FG-GAP repeat protein [Ahniella sp.]|nr:FG-GAP repeat protein [Ahniella sp.]